MRLRPTMLVIAAIVAVSAISACTGSTGAASHVGGQALPAASAAAGRAPAGGIANSDAAGSTLSLVAAKIRTARITVVIRYGVSIAGRAAAARTIAVRAGGEVDTDDRSLGKNPSATLVLRVPPQQLNRVLDEFGHLGRERSRQLSTRDVTAKVADVTSRVISARQAIARLRELYTRAVKVADVIQIENELAARESDLESLQAQQRALARQTSTAAITLSLVSAAAPAASTQHRTGFVGGLENGWDAFTKAMAALATGLGAVLPFVALLLILGLIGRLVWAHFRSRKSSTVGDG